MWLAHHGVKGMHWGVRNGPPYPIQPVSYPSNSAKVISNKMRSIKYDFSAHGLKSAEQVKKDGSGNCHDQVMLELKELRAAGYQPKAAFVMEYNPKTNQGGTTHSFVYYNEGNTTKWFENAWGGREGIHTFNNFKDIRKEIESIHSNSNEFGDNREYPKLAWGTFDDSKIKPGDTLQDIVDKSLRAGQPRG